MAQYFSRIVADHWCAKNKIEAAAHKVAQEMDRRIITSDQISTFKKEFTKKILQINQDYHRCRALSLEIEKDHLDRGDINFYISSVFHLCLFLAKE